MIEIFDITLLFIIFSLFLFSPLNLNIKNIYGYDLNQNRIIYQINVYISSLTMISIIYYLVYEEKN